MEQLFRYIIGSTSSKDSESPRPKLPQGYSDFRPQLFFQEVQHWHVVSSSLEFKLNIETGINYARFANDNNLEAPESEGMLEEAMVRATTLVENVLSDDSGEARKRLLNAVTWNDADQVRYIIRSCYITMNDSLVAIIEASSRGNEACVEALLKAGCSPSAMLHGSPKNAFHVACENGHEICARLLIDAMKSRDEAYITSKLNASTAFEIMRGQELHKMASRLEKYVEKTHLTKAHPT